MITIKKELQLEPFKVPTFVRVVRSGLSRKRLHATGTNVFALHELDNETLEVLCADFRARVLAKAATDRDLVEVEVENGGD